MQARGLVDEEAAKGLWREQRKDGGSGGGSYQRWWGRELRLVAVPRAEEDNNPLPRLKVCPPYSIVSRTTRLVACTGLS